MASLVMGSLFASKALFKYNRQNFMFDRKLKQVREFQEQDMRVEQFRLYREDVRDLVELTVGKMDLYLIAAALLADRLVVMVCLMDEALGLGSPQWMVALNTLTLASGVFYLFLTLWLAMYASVSAQSFGVRLLTQFVRLNYATGEEISKATSVGTDYEERSLAEMMRLPILQRNGPGTRDDGAASSSQPAATAGNPGSAGSASSSNPASRLSTSSMDSTDASRRVRIGGETTVEVAAGESDRRGEPPMPNLLPTAMLEHIRLYRKVQLNWQAYDAYARVSLFVGANCLLTACCYWSIGQFLQKKLALLPALGVCVIFATVQLVLARLDLRLQSWEMFGLGVLFLLTPAVTTAGMVCFPYGRKEKQVDSELVIMEFCAFAAHLLHTVLILMVLIAARPDRDSGEGALLPGKFRSSLYLDVFGWLLNANGPGPRSRTGFMRLGNRMASRGVGTGSSITDSCGSAVSQQVDHASASSFENLRPPSMGSSVQAITGSVGAGDVLSPVMPSEGSSSPSWSSPPHSPSPASQSSGNNAMGAARPRSFGSAAGASLKNLVTGGSGSRDEIRQQLLERKIDFSADIKEEMRQLFDNGSESSGSSRPPSTVQERFGGHEAAPLEVMENLTAANDATMAATFTQMPPQRVGKTVRLPGEKPWRAFCQGTTVILLMWTTSTLWCLYNMTLHRWDTSAERPHEEGAETHEEAVSRLNLLASCAMSEGFPALQVVHPGRAEVVPQARLTAPARRAASAPVVLRDSGCGLRRPVLDATLACQQPDGGAAARCVAALLRRGGRTVTLCGVHRRGRSLVLVPAASLRTAPGAPRLQRLAAGWDARSSAGLLRELRLYGRYSDGALVALRPAGPAGDRPGGAPSLRALVPQFELESASCRMSDKGCSSEGTTDNLEEPDAEMLVLSGGSLLSLGRAAGDGPAAGTCAAGRRGGLELRLWDLGTGARVSHRLSSRGQVQDSRIQLGSCSVPADQSVHAVISAFGGTGLENPTSIGDRTQKGAWSTAEMSQLLA